MPLMEINRSGNEPAIISRKPSLGQQLKQKLLTRLASISSTIRVQLPRPVDENNAPRFDEDDGVPRITSSHPLEYDSNEEDHSQASAAGDALLGDTLLGDALLHTQSSDAGGLMSLRRTVTLDDELVAPPLPSGPSGNLTARSVLCKLTDKVMCHCQVWSKLLRSLSAPEHMERATPGALAKVRLGNPTSDDK